ncbi:hypothetical protein WA026_014851 [Henosepilachna vigintioctopunctata]|uniref:CCHC-type domain-containing protein n=1 Tax=Henosepilachna vigintioctopunctata TaxID=420089 RepID=A0AAW1V1B0_9CUCU
MSKGSNQELFDSNGTGICFKCGSSEHTSFACKVVQGANYKFATCFICKEQGHISRQCPDNARGLYPKGGCCNVCGDVTHLKKDCPQFRSIQEKEQEKFQVETISSGNPDDMDKEVNYVGKITVRPNKIIKF